jgi:hypothetical protein
MPSAATRRGRRGAFLARAAGRGSMLTGTRLVRMPSAPRRGAMRTTGESGAVSTPSSTRHGPTPWRHGSWRAQRPWQPRPPPRRAWRLLRFWPVRHARRLASKRAWRPTPLPCPPPRAQRKNAVVRNHRPRCPCCSVCVPSKGKGWPAWRTFACRVTTTKGSALFGWRKSHSRSQVGFARWRGPNDAGACGGIFPPPVSMQKCL